MSMLNTFSAKTYNRIRNLEGNTILDNTNILQEHQPASMRRTKVIAGNNILSAGFSFHNLAKDVSKGVKAVNNIVPDSVKDEVKRQALNAAKTAVSQYLLPAATVVAENPELALVAAGRKNSKVKALVQGAGKKGVIPKNTEKWLDHVKEYKKKHNCTYKEALSKASASYKKK